MCDRMQPAGLPLRLRPAEGRRRGSAQLHGRLYDLRNPCPTNAIGFPPLQDVPELEKQVSVHHAIEDDLLARREQLQVKDVLPHPERTVELRITEIVEAPRRHRGRLRAT